MVTEPFFEDVAAIRERRQCFRIGLLPPLRRRWELVLLWLTLFCLYCIVALLDVSPRTVSDQLLDWTVGFWAGFLIRHAYLTLTPVYRPRVRSRRR